MKDFDFYKNIRFSKKRGIKKIFPSLHNIYNTIPETKGCVENICNCKGWCCSIQTPQFLYSEFLLIWHHIAKNWNDEQICDLIERCLLNAVESIPSKCCVFFNKNTCMCNIHKKRGYNCRIYSITPDEEFLPRYEKFKKEYEKIEGAEILPQCKLVSTCNGKKITVEDTEKWWNKIVEIEMSLGIPKKMITDEFGGSYRTPHDHILLYNMPENILNLLYEIRKYKDKKERKKAVKNIMNSICKYFKGYFKG
jgi:hypothetical protein